MTDMKGTDKMFHCTYSACVTYLISNRSGTDKEQLQLHHCIKHPPHRLNNFNSQDFNHYPFFIYIDITSIILTGRVKLYLYPPSRPH